MIGMFGDTKVYHPDELLDIADPQGSKRIPCKIIRRIHPSDSDFFFYIDTAYLNLGFLLIEEYSKEYEIETTVTCNGTVCMDSIGKPSWWKDYKSEWIEI